MIVCKSGKTTNRGGSNEESSSGNFTNHNNNVLRKFSKRAFIPITDKLFYKSINVQLPLDFSVSLLVTGSSVRTLVLLLCVRFKILSNAQNTRR